MRGSVIRMCVVMAIVAASGSWVAVSGQTATAPPQLSFAEPGISPDGREIAFVSGGDIWTVPAAGGEARLLVSHAATESRPLYSPDGRSSRSSQPHRRRRHLRAHARHRRRAARDARRWAGAARRLVARRRWIYFSSTSRDIAGMNDIYRVARRRRHADGGQRAIATRTSSSSAPSPDGTTLAFSARGNASGQWWRNGHSHLDEAEIWTARRRQRTRRAYTELTQRDGARKDCGRCGAATASRSSTCPIAAAPRTSGSGPPRRRRDRPGHDVHATAACCGRRSPRDGKHDRVRARTSRSGRSTRRPAGARSGDHAPRARPPGRRRSTCG